MIKILKYKKWKKVIEKSGLFDAKYYLFTYPDVREHDINPIMHYIKYGVHEERNPSKEFDTSFYLRTYPDVSESKMNPLVHYILYGKLENRVANKKEFRYIEEYNLLNQSELFDKSYYMQNNLDLDAKVIDPIAHYLLHGEKERRNPNKEFDTSFYLRTHPDVSESKMNPLVHYILYGGKEGRTIQNVSDLNIIEIKKNKVLCTSHNISNRDKANIKNIKNNSNIAVVLHIFYKELVNEIAQYLNNIHHDYTLIITYPKDKAQEIRPFLKTLSNKRVEIEVENYGYDILPFLQILPVLHDLDFKYFCKIHTKRDHDDLQIGKYWRESLLDGILGNKKLIDSIIDSFDKNNKLYMVGSKLNYLSYQATKYDNHHNIKILAKQLNIKFNNQDDFGFIAGTMFWGRVDTFATFSKINFELDNAQHSSGTTSSIFHAIERVFGILSLQNLNIGLVDYDLKHNDSLSVLQIDEKQKPLLTPPKYRYKAFKHRHKYLEYFLLQRSSLLDAIWCYENNLKLTKIWEDCFLMYIYNQIEFLSEKHKNTIANINYSDNKMIINYYNDTQEIVALDSNKLCENLTKFKIYEDYHMVKASDVDVSVVVATYNHEKFIKQALESIVSQKTNFKFEILVGDDCSTDKTPLIINSIHLEHPDKIIPIIRNKNIGVYNNFQELFNLAKGKYIALNEGDDFWSDINKLQLQFDYMENHKECSVCYHPVRVIDDESGELHGVFPTKLEGEKFTFERVFQSNIIQTNSVMYRNNVQKNQTLNPSTLPLDWFWHMHNSLYGEVHLLPNIMATYRKHQGGIWSKKSLFFRENSEGNILVFDEINKLSNQYLHNEVIARLINYFDKLYWYYFELQNIEKLYQLLQLKPKLANLFFRINNIPIDTYKVKSNNELLRKYQEIYKIDIIITSYNHQKYIEQTLSSVLSQKGLFSFNVIIADDFSTDNTIKKIKDTLKKFEIHHTIEILSTTKNLGMLENMKRAFKKVHGKYVAICEGDDYWISEEKIHKQLCFMLKNPAYSMCFNWLLLEYVDENYHAPHPGQSEINTKHIDFDYIMQSPITANFSCCFYKTEAIKNVPASYFEEKGNADWLFNLYIAQQGDIGFLKDILSVYRVHSSGQWSGLSQEKQKEAMKNYYEQFKKYFPEKKELIEKCLKLVDINKRKNS